MPNLKLRVNRNIIDHGSMFKFLCLYIKNITNISSKLATI